MSNGSQALRKSAKLGIGLTRLFGALGAVFRVRSPQRPHDTESSGLRGTSQFSLLKRMRKVPKFVVFLGLVLVVVLASAMVRAFALSGGCATPTITWIGNANQGPDSWHTASNWQDNLGANRVPGAGDHVCISSAANTDSIAYSTGTTSVASLESEEALTTSGGTLELTSATEESKVNNLTLSGSGTLSGAGNLTIPAGGQCHLVWWDHDGCRQDPDLGCQRLESGGGDTLDYGLIEQGAQWRSCVGERRDDHLQRRFHR
jgi:hypothetical protein